MKPSPTSPTACNEVMAIYPITPSSPMAEWCDQWASEGKSNLWGTIPVHRGNAKRRRRGRRGPRHVADRLHRHHVHGVAGAAAHGAQHVQDRRRIDCRRCSTSPPARWPRTRFPFSATTATSWPARSTGWAMLGSASVQEATDFALIAQAATLRSRIPFVHFFDGFRTSHEVQKIEMLNEADLRALIDDKLIAEHRTRGHDAGPAGAARHGAESRTRSSRRARRAIRFTPPARTSCSRRWTSSPKQVGRSYKLFEYVGVAARRTRHRADGLGLRGGA